MNQTAEIKKIGFIGLGNVGAKLAGSILRNKFDLTVRDIDEETAQPFLDDGAKWGESPKQMAEECDLVITCLPSPKICASVMEEKNGLLEGLGENKIWAEMSTTDVEEVKRLAELVKQKGASAIECPVSGGCHRAATGNISIFAGCDRKTFEKMLPVLTTLGRRILHTGEIGTASILKVMTNYLATANLVTICEALVTMKAANFDLAKVYQAIEISSGTSFVAETEGQVILNGSRDISFTMDLVSKDIGLFQKIADKHNVPLEISPMLINIFQDGEKKYGSRELSPNIIRRLEDAVGVQILADGFPEEMIDDEPEQKGDEVMPRGT